MVARQKWYRETLTGDIAHSTGLLLIGAGVAMAALGIYETGHLRSESSTVCVDTATPPVCEPISADPNALRAAEELAAAGTAAAIIGAAALVSANNIDKSVIVWSCRRKFDIQKELLLAGRDYELAEPEPDIVDRFED